MQYYNWWRLFLMDTFKDKPEILETFERAGIERAFQRVSMRDQEILMMMYGKRMSPASIGNYFNISKARVQGIVGENKHWFRYRSTIEILRNPIPVEGTKLLDLNLSNRAFNALQRKGVRTIEELGDIPIRELRLIKNLGPGALKEIQEKLEAYYIEKRGFKMKIDKSGMSLENISKIIYVEGTASENTNIKVVTLSDNRTLWEGKAKDLKDADVVNDSWNVNEILVDHYRSDERHLPEYNKSKIIVVY